VETPTSQSAVRSHEPTAEGKTGFTGRLFVLVICIYGILQKGRVGKTKSGPVSGQPAQRACKESSLFQS